MKNSLKKNWKGITATVVAFGAVCGSIYYVNCIYLPNRQQAEAAKLTAIQPVAPPKDYNFAVSTANSQTPDTSANSTNPANDRIKVTTDQDGNVTVDRTWDAKPGELDTSTAAPNAPTANIGSGGGTITGTDGAYHGEQPTATTPSTGTTTTKPATDSSKTTTKPSTTPPAPAKPSKPTPKAPSNSTPQMGDTRVVDGKEQMYVEGFGWTDVGDGGHTNSIDMPDELSGIQVGEMG